MLTIFKRVVSLPSIVNINYKFSAKAFQAIHNQTIRKQVEHHKNQKLDAFVQVLLSLTNKELTYLNELQNQRNLQNNQQILKNKIFNMNGQVFSPIQFMYQSRWIKKQWKQAHLLTTVIIPEDEQDSGKQDEQVVKQIWDIQLTSVDPSSKIKLIKVLRQMFNLGLKEAKQIADKTPSIIKKDKKQECQKIKVQLQKNGCVITIK